MGIVLRNNGLGGKLRFSGASSGGFKTTYIPLSIITSGLILNLDASNSYSYPGSGTTWTDISGNGYNGTLILVILFGISSRESIILSTTICLWFSRK